jgi:hypothetical protein
MQLSRVPTDLNIMTILIVVKHLGETCITLCHDKLSIIFPIIGNSSTKRQTPVKMAAIVIDTEITIINDPNHQKLTI